MIEFSNVQAGRPGVILMKGFSWRINDGEQWLVQGPNGSGKTLLLELLAGKVHPTQGDLHISFIDGDSWDERYAQRKRYIHYTPTHAVQSLLKQDQHQYYQQRYYAIGDQQQPTVRDVLVVSDDALAALNLPAEFSIEHLLPVEVNRLSNGQLKKLLLIKILLTGIPKLMLLDYPFEGLDQASRLALCRFIDFLITAHGMQVVIVDQHNELPTRINRILRLNAFQVVLNDHYPFSLTGSVDHSSSHVFKAFDDNLRAETINGDATHETQPAQSTAAHTPVVKASNPKILYDKHIPDADVSNSKTPYNEHTPFADVSNPKIPHDEHTPVVEVSNQKTPSDENTPDADVSNLKIQYSEHTPVVEVSNLKIQYGEHVILKDFSWRVNQGERWALVGRNGAGKTTLFSMIFADHPMAYSQNVYLFGRKRGTGESIWEIKRRISYLGPEQLSYLSPAHIQISAHEYLLRALKHWDAHLFAQLAGAFDANSFLNLPVRALSSGQLQVVLIMQCLLASCELLLLDEPFQFLDAQRKASLNKVLSTYLDNDKTLILITHYASDLTQWTSFTKNL